MFMAPGSYLQVPLKSDGDRCVVGVIADTHLPYRLKALPSCIYSIFEDVDLILHAGDVDQLDCLAELEKVAPVYAVRGNLHFLDFSDGGLATLPLDLRLDIAGYRVVVNHGAWPGFISLASDWFMEKIFDRSRQSVNRRIARRLLQQYPEADVLIFGHSHYPHNVRQGRALLFNPGGVCPYRQFPTSVGRLTLTPEAVEANVIELDVS
jgi:uncharacterized protein